MGGFFLYKITSPLSDRFYVGITGTSPSKRMGDHRYEASKRRYRMSMWMRKHTCASMTVAASGMTKAEALIAEKFAVAFFKKKCPELLLNTLDGGIPGRHGIKHSEETCQKISESKRRMGLKCPEHVKECLRALHYGKKKTAETRAKMSAAKKLAKVHPNTRAAQKLAASKPVALVDDAASIEFPSIKAAGKYLGVSEYAAGRAARKGYYGRYRIVYITVALRNVAG